MIPSAGGPSHAQAAVSATQARRHGRQASIAKRLHEVDPATRALVRSHSVTSAASRRPVFDEVMASYMEERIRGSCPCVRGGHGIAEQLVLVELGSSAHEHRDLTPPHPIAREGASLWPSNVQHVGTSGFGHASGLVAELAHPRRFLVLAVVVACWEASARAPEAGAVVATLVRATCSARDPMSAA